MKVEIWHQDFPTNGPKLRPRGEPVELLNLLDFERVICVETLTDAAGYATHRVWVAREWPKEAHP
jgi:hypothetical protein